MLKSFVRVPPGSRRLLSILLLTGMSFPVAAQDMTIYSDSSLQNGWQNWSWDTTVNFGNTNPVYSGSSSAAVTISAAWGALYLNHAAFNSGTYSNLVFWINGGTNGGQQLLVAGHAGGAQQLSMNLPALTANAWLKFSIPLSTLGIANRSDVDGLWIADRVGSAQPTFYVDEMVLTTNSNPLPIVTLTSPTDGSVYTAPAGINLSAGVAANGHVITKVQFYSNSTNLLNEDSAAPYSFTWTNVGAGAYILKARAIYDAGAGVDSPAAYVTVAGNIPVAINIDAQLNRHAISPLIYGVAFATSNQLRDLNFPINRSGGNSETRYNWQLNAHNHGADWYFESIDDGSAIPGASADDFVNSSKNGGARAMITIPMIGWTPRLGASRGKLASYSIAKYGPQTDNDWQWMPDAGNGKASPSSAAITNNDPNDANFLTNSAFQQAYVQHLIGRWGSSTNGGVRYYLMDNEHSIWFSTHQDVPPIGPTMQEIRDKTLEYAGMVKSNDPSALVCAPEEWGWSGYFYSGYDQQNSGFHDRANNGGWDYMPWLLNQFHQHDLGTGLRLLDYFTLHCYPQAGEFGDDVSTAMQLLRNTSTRQFWDTNYVDESWIGQQAPPNNVLMLIPRMKNWVASYYPGTGIGVTEYNWGAETNINGATAQADLLGIFGRESLDLATRWTTPDTGTPTYNAMKMYRSYDGNKSTFGDTSVSASVPNPDNVSAFAAVRSSDGALTVMVINKQLTAGAALSINLANFPAGGSAQVWQLTSADLISRLSDVSLVGNTLSTTVPVQSITLFIVPAGTVPPPPQLIPGGMSSTNTFYFSLTNGMAGFRYVIQASADLVNWQPVLTNTLAGSSTNFVIPAPDALRFYRAQWAL